MLFSKYTVSVLSTRCGGCHHKALIVASSYKKANDIHSNKKKNFHQHDFYMPVPFLFLNKFNKKINLKRDFFYSVHQFALKQNFLEKLSDIALSTYCDQSG